MAFKPQLYPNFGVGVIPDWETLIQVPEDWMVSYKYDGNRAELKLGLAVGRSLKPIKSWHIQAMAEQMYNKYPLLTDPNVIVEAEFYAPGFTFAEIQHFYRSGDVTSAHTRKDLQREWDKTKGGTETYKAWRKIRGEKVEVDVSWGFPGRDVDWLCMWHSELRFYIFDMYMGDDSMTKLERYMKITDTFPKHCPYQVPIVQYKFENLFKLTEFYHYAVDLGLEGLMLVKEIAPYKRGRYTEKEAMAFKMKNDNNEMDGVITDVLEGDKVKDGVARTVDKLGYSVTSAKQDDREPSGKAKGFEVLLEDGQTTTVSLKGYSDPEKVLLLTDAPKYKGRAIRFHAMAPVKKGGLPRHAHFTKDNFIESKT